MAHFTLSTHGVAVEVEYPGRTLLLERRGSGTLVEQPAGSDNWFHFAVPTLNLQEDTHLKPDRVYFDVQAIEGTDKTVTARINRVHVRDGREFLYRNDNWSSASRPVKIVDLSTIGQAVVVSLHANWIETGGSTEPSAGDSRLEFVFAGVRFEEF